MRQSQPIGLLAQVASPEMGQAEHIRFIEASAEGIDEAVERSPDFF
jgi:hypothetical protein